MVCVVGDARGLAWSAGGGRRRAAAPLRIQVLRLTVEFVPSKIATRPTDLSNMIRVDQHAGIGMATETPSPRAFIFSVRTLPVRILTDVNVRILTDSVL